MDRRRFLRCAGASTVLSLPALAGCGGDGNGTPTELGENAIGMYTEGSSWFFDPIGLHVEPDTTITWVNMSGQHSTTAYEEGNSIASVTRIPDGADAWHSGTLTRSGETFEHTLEIEGTYDYFCVPHKSFGMVGRVVVGDPGGPTTGDPPDGQVPGSESIVEQGAVAHADFVG